jgi:hypothetical protein
LLSKSTNEFRFTLTGSRHLVIVVEGCANHVQGCLAAHAIPRAGDWRVSFRCSSVGELSKPLLPSSDTKIMTHTNLRLTVYLIAATLFAGGPLIAADGQTSGKNIFKSPDIPAHPASYSEPLRPQYHFTPEKNWMNDPDGLVFYAGEYHLFYQYNPLGNIWDHMSWGHAVSTDLIHWKHLPVALREADGLMIFTGSAVVDWNKTSGFGLDGNPPWLPFTRLIVGRTTCSLSASPTATTEVSRGQSTLAIPSLI